MKWLRSPLVNTKLLSNSWSARGIDDWMSRLPRYDTIVGHGVIPLDLDKLTVYRIGVQRTRAVVCVQDLWVWLQAVGRLHNLISYSTFANPCLLFTLARAHHLHCSRFQHSIQSIKNCQQSFFKIYIFVPKKIQIPTQFPVQVLGCGGKFLARSRRVLTTDCLCCIGCSDIKLRYLSEWVGLRYTAESKWPLGECLIKFNQL